MTDLRTQEPSHLLSPDQRLLWTQRGPGTSGMERASEGPGSRTPGLGRQAGSHGGLHLRWAHLLGLLQDVAQAPQAWSLHPSLAPSHWRPQLSWGAGTEVRGGWGAVGAAVVLPQDQFNVPHELPQLGLLLGSVPLVVKAAVSL